MLLETIGYQIFSIFFYISDFMSFNEILTIIFFFIVCISMLITGIFLLKNSDMSRRKSRYKKIMTFFLLVLIDVIILKIKYNKYNFSFSDIISITCIVFGIFFLLYFIIAFLKVNSQKKKKILFTILIIILVWLSLFTIDFFRVKNKKTPIFCTSFGNILMIQDGGTVEYIGLGYKVFYFNTTITYDTYDEMIWDYYSINEPYLCPLWTTYEEALKIVKNNTNIQK